MTSLSIPAAGSQYLPDLLARVPGPPRHQGRARAFRIEFVGGAQVAQVRRTVTRNDKKTVEVVYLITSDPAAAPVIPAAWVRGHRHAENKLH